MIVSTLKVEITFIYCRTLTRIQNENANCFIQPQNIIESYYCKPGLKVWRDKLSY